MKVKVGVRRATDEMASAQIMMSMSSGLTRTYLQDHDAGQVVVPSEALGVGRRHVRVDSCKKSHLLWIKGEEFSISSGEPTTFGGGFFFSVSPLNYQQCIPCFTLTLSRAVATCKRCARRFDTPLTTSVAFRSAKTCSTSWTRAGAPSFRVKA